MTLSIFSKAFHFAHVAHTGQVRKYTDEPYVNHCLAVARLVRERTYDEEVVAAAMLHDVLEDTDTTEEELKKEFGTRITQLVVEVTDVFTKEKYPLLNRFARKKREAKRLGTISDDAKLIKLCDLIDNTSTIIKYDPGFSVIYLREKADILEAMGY